MIKELPEKIMFKVEGVLSDKEWQCCTSRAVTMLINTVNELIDYEKSKENKHENN